MQHIMILFVQKLITKDNNNMIREKRDSRLTADISETAHELLRSAVIKFDSSKGKLIEKMIFNFLAETPAHEKPGRGIVVTTSLDKPKAPKAKRKVATYPDNLDEQFLLLWDTKGKKGAKQKAYEKYRSMMAGNDSDICEKATMIFIDDINKNKGECG